MDVRGEDEAGTPGPPQPESEASDPTAFPGKRRIDGAPSPSWGRAAHLREAGRARSGRLLAPGRSCPAVIEAVSCSGAQRASQVKVEGRLDGDARCWRELLLYRTIVDEKIRWHARASLCSIIVLRRSWDRIGHDRVFVPCERNPGRLYVPQVLRRGRHTLKMQAFLPGTGYRQHSCRNAL